MKIHEDSTGVSAKLCRRFSCCLIATSRLYPRRERIFWHHTCKHCKVKKDIDRSMFSCSKMLLVVLVEAFWSLWVTCLAHPIWHLVEAAFVQDSKCECEVHFHHLSLSLMSPMSPRGALVLRCSLPGAAMISLYKFRAGSACSSSYLAMPCDRVG